MGYRLRRLENETLSQTEQIQDLQLEIKRHNKRISDLEQSIAAKEVISETIGANSDRIVSILHDMLNSPTPGKTRKMVVTAYCPCGKCNGKHAGKTASGIRPRQYEPGKKGSIAADTRYYPFGTEIYVPGYGWGVVEDGGGAIKGPNRLDLFYDDHGSTKRWGRRHVEVEIYHNPAG